MSLIPLMKLRLAAPEHVVDISRIPGLSYIREEAGRHPRGRHDHALRDRNSSPLLRGKCPLLAETAAQHRRRAGAQHGHDRRQRRACRSGGRLSRRPLRARSQGAPGQRQDSDRTLTHGEFLVDTMTTAIEPGEIVLEVILPVEAGGTGVSYQKMAQPASGFALVGVAARVAKAGGTISMARVGVTGVAPKAYRAANVEDDAGRQGRLGRRRSGRQPRSWPTAWTPTPTCTPRRTTAPTWRASTPRAH